MHADTWLHVSALSSHESIVQGSSSLQGFGA
jgi:hypothetical protein